MDDNTHPEDPVTSLAVGAVQQHEMFLAYVHAGFTRDEALKLIGAIMAAHIRNENS